MKSIKPNLDQEVVDIYGRESGVHPFDIAELLKNKKIKKINLHWYGLDDWELTKICKNLEQNHSLKELNIIVENFDSFHSSSFYGATSFSGAIRGEGAIALAQAITINSSLYKISLLQPMRGISVESAITLTASVCKNPNIKAFALHIAGRDKIHEVMAPFKSNKTLTELHLSFYPGLSYSPYLTETDMHCVTDSLGLEQDDCSLGKLGLIHNGITAQTLKPLIESIKNNTSLHALDLIGNLIGNEGAAMLIELLIANQNIKELRYNTQEVSKENQQQIKQLLECNKLLHSAQQLIMAKQNQVSFFSYKLTEGFVGEEFKCGATIR